MTARMKTTQQTTWVDDCTVCGKETLTHDPKIGLQAGPLVCYDCRVERQMVAGRAEYARLIGSTVVDIEVHADSVCYDLTALVVAIGGHEAKRVVVSAEHLGQDELPVLGVGNIEEKQP